MSRTRLLLAAVLTITGAHAAVFTTSTPVAASSTSYQSLPAPIRLLDTRPGNVTADGQLAGEGLRPADSVLSLPVANRVGLPPSPAAVVLNVTVTEPAEPGFVTVFPCDQPRPTASSLNYAAYQTVANAVIATVGGGGDVCLYTLGPTHLIVDVSGWFPEGGYVALPAPRRLLDTRPDGVTADGTHANTGPADFSVIAVQVAGRVGFASDATAVALNVTITEPESAGFLTAFPCGVAQPNASNLNFTPGQTVPNLVISGVGAGAVCFYVHARAHVVVDAYGALPATEFVPLDAPRRLLDTRPGNATDDGQLNGEGAQPPGSSLQLPVAGRAGIPGDATAAILNVTAVTPAVPGFVTVHPRGTPQPIASNLNHMPGDVVANAVIARIGAGGEVCVFTSGATDLVIDVAGWLVGAEPPTTGEQCPSVVPSDPNAIATLLARPAVHAAVGVDRIALLACDIAGDPTPAPDPADVAVWANEKVTPYFVAVSGGLYRPEFFPHVLGRINVVDLEECVLGGREQTTQPFTNVIVYDSGDYGGGQAGPGLLWSNVDIPVLSVSPRQSWRGGWIGGGVPFVNESVLIHEIGHTIHWPHSYTGADGEYDNPIDIMSGEPRRQVDDPNFPEDWCPHPDGGFIWCKPQLTLAFNRMAAGWVAPQQVAIHRSGHANYTLDRTGGSGVQLLALPDAVAPLSSMVIDARPALGYDAELTKGGVSVHLIDQGDGRFDTISIRRRHRQAVGGPLTYSHVIGVGETLTVDGVRITVTEAAGEGYKVVVVGRYSRPASLYGETRADGASCAAQPLQQVAGQRCWK